MSNNPMIPSNDGRGNPSIRVFRPHPNAEPQRLIVGQFHDECHKQRQDYEVRMKRLHDGMPGINF